jgi:hypothetical protein
MHVSPHTGMKDTKINVYTKTSVEAWSYTNWNVEHVCNCVTTLWTLERGKGKENDRASVISHTIRCKGRGYKNVYWKLLKNRGMEVKG